MLIILLGMALAAVVGFVLTVRASGFRSLAKHVAVLVAIALMWWVLTISGVQPVARDYHKDAVITSVMLLDAFIGGGVLGAMARSIILLFRTRRGRVEP